MSTKLSNGIEYTNSNLPLVHAEYLIMNGFKTSMSKKGNLRFYKPESHDVFIQDDTIDFFKKTATVMDSQWQFQGKHAGISKLDFYGFITLMNIMGIVTYGEYLQNSLKQGVQHAAQASFIIQELTKRIAINQ